ncbi:hypothetical protein BDD43_1318 [Mucilaginibacter gracilis]|uniref:Leucine rich repeat (LRR) protein n=1 Tax=Mucilaginibacter gracilis TaxID=423350 RepID=A0A495IYN7_9SPHI|nr:hypothetical protein [Mucilaginibacter gracilis]RKR81174.1 hypothetical protein BDD43_1318 [Mucilaginibacter gracilis]
MIRSERIQNPAKIDRDFIDRLLKTGYKVIVQFSDRLYTDKILEELNELCLKYDENFNIRFYGHHSNSFDCSIVDKIPFVKSLNVDCITNAQHIEALTKPLHLKQFWLGVYELKDTEILQADNFKKLTSLGIADTKTKALNLKYLSDFKNLTSLLIAKHTKNIDAVGELKGLTNLNLNSISKVPLNFVNNLKQLKRLRILLGGRDNINEIHNNAIEQLELIWIRGLNELNNLDRFSKLKSLHIEDQIRLSRLDFDNVINELTDIKILNCKTFSAVTGLEKLPALSHMRIYGTAIDFESFVKQEFPKSLEILAFYTGKKIDKEIKLRLETMGYVDGMGNNS